METFADGLRPGRHADEEADDGMPGLPGLVVDKAFQAAVQR